MKQNQTSMGLIPEATNTVVISSELGYGLTNDVEPTKFCTRCKRVLPHHCFSKKTNTKDGLQHYCKQCQSEQNQERYYQRKSESNTQTKLHHVYNNPELAKFTPRQLMEELKARGFKWDYMIEPQKKIMFDKI